MELATLILMIVLLLLSFCTNMIGLCTVWGRAIKNKKQAKAQKVAEEITYLENLKATTNDVTAQAMINLKIEDLKKSNPKK